MNFFTLLIGIDSKFLQRPLIKLTCPNSLSSMKPEYVNSIGSLSITYLIVLRTGNYMQVQERSQFVADR